MFKNYFYYFESQKKRQPVFEVAFFVFSIFLSSYMRGSVSKLDFVQISIHAVFLKLFVVITDFNDMPVFHYDNAICSFNS